MAQLQASLWRRACYSCSYVLGREWGGGGGWGMEGVGEKVGGARLGCGNEVGEA